MTFARVQKVDTGKYRRIIAVSDIHGNGHLLTRLLERLDFCSNDALILLGDYIERGKDSLSTVRSIMALCAQGNVFALMGNCDTLWDDIKSGLYCVDINAYIDWRHNTILADMCGELDIDRRKIGSNEVERILLDRYGEVFDWLRSLPHIIDTPEAVFVHAGIDPDIPLTAQDAERCLKRTAFLEEEHVFSKKVICGHIPTSNYFMMRNNVLSYAPVTSGQVTCIDGGNAVKHDGQLNALVLEDGATRYIAEDDLDEATVCGEQRGSKDVSSVAWNHREVEVMCKIDGCSLFRVISTGLPLWAPDNLIYKTKSGIVCCEDYTDYRPCVKQGDRVKLVKSGEKYSIIKKNSEIGWIYTSILTLT